MSDIVHPDLVFECKNCGHTVYVDKLRMDFIVSLAKAHCPDCQTKRHLNWILKGEGTSDYRKKKKE